MSWGVCGNILILLRLILMDSVVLGCLFLFWKFGLMYGDGKGLRDGLLDMIVFNLLIVFVCRNVCVLGFVCRLDFGIWMIGLVKLVVLGGGFFYF